MHEVGEVLFKLNSQDESGGICYRYLKPFSVVFLAVGIRKWLWKEDDRASSIWVNKKRSITCAHRQRISYMIPRDTSQKWITKFCLWT